MKYDEPPCPWYGYDCFGCYPTSSPSSAPSSSLSPASSPPFCDPNYNNANCLYFYECYSTQAQGDRTLYVTLNFQDYYFTVRKDVLFQCLKSCPFETNPPTPEPTARSRPTLAPVPSSTGAPVKAPTNPPTPAPARRFCFSGRAEVQVQGKGAVRMDELSIGDAVQVADGAFSKVYSFGHYDPHCLAEFFADRDIGEPQGA